MPEESRGAEDDRSHPTAKGTGKDPEQARRTIDVRYLKAVGLLEGPSGEA